MKTILQWWVGHKLPLIHVKFKSGFKKLIADLAYHPIKRRFVRLYVKFLQYFFGLKVIAVTGSAGKTSVKETIASILSLNGKTIYSLDNIDPIFNIPNTILRCRPNTKYLVLEFGVEYPNEMDFYLWLVKPETGVITNIFPTHTLYFGDRQGVFIEKKKLVENTKFAVLNSNDEYLITLKNKLNSRISWFNVGKTFIDTNINAAVSVAKIYKVNEQYIKRGVENRETLKHRFSIINHKSGAVIVDDTYNSNPEAFIQSINYFNKLAGKNKKILVIGDMLELGDIAKSEHLRIARYLKKGKYQKIFGVGDLVKNITNNIYDLKSIVKQLETYLKPKTYIFLKGSRSIHLDTVVDQLTNI